MVAAIMLIEKNDSTEGEKTSKGERKILMGRSKK
jgi:hypothetical protein